MKHVVVILGVLALLAISQAQKDDSIVADSSGLSSAAVLPSDPSRPKPIHFGNGLYPAQPVESENLLEENENNDANLPERVPVWNIELKFNNKG